MMQRNILAVDVETTGIDPVEHGLLSIGAITLDGESTFEGQCRTDKIVTEKALEINGFTVEEARDPDKPSEASLVNTFLRYVGKLPNAPYVMLGYNVAFDEAFIYNNWNDKDSNSPPWPFSYRTVDLHAIGVYMFGVSLNHIEFGRRLLVQPEPEPHTALNGARWARACFIDLWLKRELNKR